MFYVSLVGNTGLAAAADVLSCVERIGLLRAEWLLNDVMPKRWRVSRSLLLKTALLAKPSLDSERPFRLGAICFTFTVLRALQLLSRLCGGALWHVARRCRRRRRPTLLALSRVGRWEVCVVVMLCYEWIWIVFCVVRFEFAAVLCGTNKILGWCYDILRSYSDLMIFSLLRCLGVADVFLLVLLAFMVLCHLWLRGSLFVL